MNLLGATDLVVGASLVPDLYSVIDMCSYVNFVSLWNSFSLISEFV